MVWEMGGLGGILERSVVMRTPPRGFGATTSGWHHGDGSSPVGVMIPWASMLSSSFFTSSWYAKGICQGLYMANGCASSRRCILMGGPFIGRSVVLLRSCFVTKTSAYSLRKYSLACEGVVISDQDGDSLASDGG